MKFYLNQAFAKLKHYFIKLRFPIFLNPIGFFIEIIKFLVFGVLKLFFGGIIFFSLVRLFLELTGRKDLITDLEYLLFTFGFLDFNYQEGIRLTLVLVIFFYTTTHLYYKNKKIKNLNYPYKFGFLISLILSNVIIISIYLEYFSEYCKSYDNVYLAIIFTTLFYFIGNKFYRIIADEANFSFQKNNQIKLELGLIHKDLDWDFSFLSKLVFNPSIALPLSILAGYFIASSLFPLTLIKVQDIFFRDIKEKSLINYVKNQDKSYKYQYHLKIKSDDIYMYLVKYCSESDGKFDLVELNELGVLEEKAGSLHKVVQRESYINNSDNECIFSRKANEMKNIFKMEYLLSNKSSLSKCSLFEYRNFTPSYWRNNMDMSFSCYNDDFILLNESFVTHILINKKTKKYEKYENKANAFYTIINNNLYHGVDTTLLNFIGQINKNNILVAEYVCYNDKFLVDREDINMIEAINIKGCNNANSKIFDWNEFKINKFNGENKEKLEKLIEKCKNEEYYNQSLNEYTNKNSLCIKI